MPFLTPDKLGLHQGSREGLVELQGPHQAVCINCLYPETKPQTLRCLQVRKRPEMSFLSWYRVQELSPSLSEALTFPQCRATLLSAKVAASAVV